LNSISKQTSLKQNLKTSNVTNAPWCSWSFVVPKVMFFPTSKGDMFDFTINYSLHCMAFNSLVCPIIPNQKETQVNNKIQ
jgi:hypothetical protein